MENYGKAVMRYIQMLLSKLTLDDFVLRSHILRSTAYDLKSGAYDASLEDLATMSYWLKCRSEVIIGREPCLAKCPHCIHYRP